MSEREELEALRRLAELEEKASSGASAQPKQSYAPKMGGKIGARTDPNPLLAIPETAAAIGSGMMAAPVAGISGLAAIPLHAAGITKKDPGEVVREVQGAMTYEPRTEVGRGLTGAVSTPFSLLAQGAESAGDLSMEYGASPGFATTLNTGLQSVPSVFGARGATAVGRSARARIQRALERQGGDAVRNETLARGRELGMGVIPSEINPGAINRVVESLAGKAALKQEATLRNQQITSRSAAQDIGLAPGTAVTPNRLDALRYQLAEPYREVASLPQTGYSMASPAALLDELRTVRADASQWRAAQRANPHPETLAEARRLEGRAEQIEGQLEGIARQAGRADLVPRLRDARMRIAKTYDVQDALNLGNADVRSPVLGRQLDRGERLSGNLETIARMQQAFPQVMGEGARTPTPGVSATNPALAAAGAAQGGPTGTFLGSLPLISEGARNMALSPWYQNRFASPNYNVGPMTRALSNIPESQRGIVAALLARQAATQQAKQNAKKEEEE